jgi:diadenosine tetraphosphate (Ap4A) HIT family hydrolase
MYIRPFAILRICACSGQCLFVTVCELNEDLNLEERGYRLIVNGGEYQEFPQLHFHLISGE